MIMKKAVTLKQAVFQNMHKQKMISLFDSNHLTFEGEFSVHQLSGFTKLQMCLVDLVKKMSAHRNFLLQN